MRETFYYLLAFALAAVVTYVLPGTSEDDAFVDVMGIFLSVTFWCFGVLCGIRAYLKRENLV